MAPYVIEYTEAATGRRKRVTYKQQPLGDWTRRVEKLRGDAWLTVGTETVTDVAIQCGDGHTKVGP